MLLQPLHRLRQVAVPHLDLLHHLLGLDLFLQSRLLFHAPVTVKTGAMLKSGEQRTILAMVMADVVATGTYDKAFGTP